MHIWMQQYNNIWGQFSGNGSLQADIDVVDRQSQTISTHWNAFNWCTFDIPLYVWKGTEEDEEGVLKSLVLGL